MGGLKDNIEFYILKNREDKRINDERIYLVRVKKT